jgi:transposase-like protein
MAQQLFTWKHFKSEIIILRVRWYLKYPLSYRMLGEMTEERGLQASHTTIMRWVHPYAPIIDEKIRKHLEPTNDSWRMDETYIKIKGKNDYLYRAVDSAGNTIDFFVSEHRDKDAAKRFFTKAIKVRLNQQPRVITIDQYAATEIGINELIYAGTLSPGTTIRKTKYLNNIIEQDHRFIKRKTRPMLGFDSFETAVKTICGIEAMHKIRKGQIEEIRCVLSEVAFINKILGVTA